MHNAFISAFVPGPRRRRRAVDKAVQRPSTQRRHHGRPFLGTAFAVGLAFFLGQAHPVGAGSPPEKSKDIKLDDARIPEPPSGAKTAAGYFTVRNFAASSDRLLQASSPAANAVELHEMSMAGGIMRMRELKDGVAVAAGQTISFSSGGDHLMLIGLHRPLKAGERVPMTLRFAKAGPLFVSFLVQPASAIQTRAPAAMSMPMPMSMPKGHR